MYRPRLKLHFYNLSVLSTLCFIHVLFSSRQNICGSTDFPFALCCFSVLPSVFAVQCLLACFASHLLSGLMFGQVSILWGTNIPMPLSAEFSVFSPYQVSGLHNQHSRLQWILYSEQILKLGWSDFMQIWYVAHPSLCWWQHLQVCICFFHGYFTLTLVYCTFT